MAKSTNETTGNQNPAKKKYYKSRRNADEKPEPSRQKQLIQKKNPDTAQRNQPKRQYQKNSFLSVVIPLLNEEESLPELSLKLEAELTKIVNNRWEVILIDDGSTDASFDMIRKINKRNNKFKCIRFRKNFGKSAALDAGFKRAKGNVIITMDADLQDEPEEIKNLVAKLDDGFDLVSGWKKVRKDPFIKRFSSKFFNLATSFFSKVRLHDFNCGLKAYKRDVVKSLTVYGEMHRFLPAIAHMDGFKVTEIPVVHHKRIYGKTKFGVSRFIKGYLDLLTVVFLSRFLKRPLHFFGTLGSMFAATGFIIDLVLSIQWALGLTSLSNRPLALLGIAMIIVGVQFISMGLIGEIIVKNSSSAPVYKIKETL